MRQYAEQINQANEILPQKCKEACADAGYANIDEQEKIASIMIKIDEKIKLIRQKKNLLEELFNSMLHKLMSDQIRVTNLDETYFGERPFGV